VKVPIKIMDIDEGEVIAICKVEETQLKRLDVVFEGEDLTFEPLDGDIPEFETAEEVLAWLKNN
jgi:hypothetical protein